MKQCILFMLWCLQYTMMYAQVPLNKNHDFLMGFGHHIYTSPPGSVVFPCTSLDEAKTPEWRVTHGHPHIEPVTDGTRCLFLEDAGGSGHGAAVEYTFLPGNYIITISLCDSGASGGRNSFVNGLLSIRLHEYLPYNRTFAFCSDVPPLSTPGWATNVGSLSGLISGPYTQSFPITVPVLPGGAHLNYLTLMPFRTFSGTNVRAYIRDVSIYRVCTEEEKVIGNFIVPGTYEYTRHIYSGSVFDPSLNLTSTDPAGNTVFRASESVEIRENFLAVPFNEHYFLADISPSMCGSNYNRSSGESGGDGNNVAGLQMEPIKLLEGRQIAPQLVLHPNPSNGDFKLTLLNEGTCRVTVINSIGQTVYTDNLTGNQQHAIHLDDRLPPGNYLLQVVGDGMRHTERITIVR